LAAVLLLALIEAIALPARWWPKGLWGAIVIVLGTLAAGVAIWEQQQTNEAAAAIVDEELAALRGLWTQWQAIAATLPPPPDAKPAATFETVAEAVASLSAEVASIQAQIEALRAKAKARSVDADTAAALADYLRPFGAHRVVVSCAPDDVEAYTYANQLAGTLRAAGWDAPGPELSRVPGGAPSMALSLFTRDPRSPEAARLLVDAFTRFNIPFRAGIAPNEAIPDPATAEIYVAPKP
jgi:hypothetical protein